MDIIRVLRLLEYVGPRDVVERCLDRSIHGEKIIRQPGCREFRVRATTLGNIAEILRAASEEFERQAEGPIRDEDATDSIIGSP